MKEIIESLNNAVRPLVTMLFAAAIVYGFIVSLISGETFLTIASVVIGFWFREREEVKNREERHAERIEAIKADKR
jgi:hypothetical protein